MLFFHFFAGLCLRSGGGGGGGVKEVNTVEQIHMYMWLGCRGKVDMEHMSVSSSSFIYTRTKPGIHQRKYTYKYTTMTSYKLSAIILTSLSTPKYKKKSAAAANRSHEWIKCCLNQTGASSANTLLRTWYQKNSHTTTSTHTDYRSTSINNSTTVPHTTQK